MMGLTSKLFNMCLEWMSIAFAGCEGYLLWSYDYCFLKVIFMNPFISWRVITGILRLKVPETSSGPGMRLDCIHVCLHQSTTSDFMNASVSHPTQYFSSEQWEHMLHQKRSIVPLQKIELIKISHFPTWTINTSINSIFMSIMWHF